MTVSVVMMHGWRRGVVRRRSEADPGALVVDANLGFMARDGVEIEARKNVALIILALAGRPGAVVTTDEMVEMLWGDRADGGPDEAYNMLTRDWLSARAALTALGYAAARYSGRGFSAWPVRRRNDAEDALDIPRFLELAGRRR